MKNAGGVCSQEAPCKHHVHWKHSGAALPPFFTPETTKLAEKNSVAAVVPANTTNNSLAASTTAKWFDFLIVFAALNTMRL